MVRKDFTMNFLTLKSNFNVLIYYSVPCLPGKYCANGLIFKCPSGSVSAAGASSVASCNVCVISMGYDSFNVAPSTYTPPRFDTKNDMGLVALLAELADVANGNTGLKSAFNAPFVGFLPTNESFTLSERVHNTYATYIYNKLVAKNDATQWDDASTGSFISSGNYINPSLTTELSNYFFGSRLKFQLEDPGKFPGRDTDFIPGHANLLIRDLTTDSLDAQLPVASTSTPSSNTQLIFGSSTGSVASWYVGNDVLLDRAYHVYDALLTYAIFKESAITLPSSTLENIITAFGGLQQGSRLAAAMTGQFSKLTDLCAKAVNGGLITKLVGTTQQPATINECFDKITPYALKNLYVTDSNSNLLYYSGDDFCSSADSKLDSSITGFLNFIIYQTAYLIASEDYRIHSFAPSNINNEAYSNIVVKDFLRYDLYQDFRSFKSCNTGAYFTSSSDFGSLIMLYFLQRLPFAWVGSQSSNSNDNYAVLRAGTQTVFDAVNGLNDNLMVLINTLYYTNADGNSGALPSEVTQFAADWNAARQAYDQLYSSFNWGIYNGVVQAAYGAHIPPAQQAALHSSFSSIGNALAVPVGSARYAHNVNDNFASGFGIAMIDGGYAPGFTGIPIGAAVTGASSISYAYDHFINLNINLISAGLKSRSQIAFAVVSNSFPLVDICTGTGVGGAIANYAALMGHCRSVVTFGSPKFTYTAFHPLGQANLNDNSANRAAFGGLDHGGVHPYTIGAFLKAHASSASTLPEYINPNCRLDSPMQYTLQTFTRRVLQNADPLLLCDMESTDYPIFGTASQYKNLIAYIQSIHITCIVVLVVTIYFSLSIVETLLLSLLWTLSYSKIKAHVC